MKEPLRLWMPDDKGEMQLTLLEDEHAEQYVYLDDYRELESKLDARDKELAGAIHDRDVFAQQSARYLKERDQAVTDRDDAVARMVATERKLAEFSELVTVRPGTVREDVNALRNLLRKSMYLTRKEAELRIEAEGRLDAIRQKCAHEVAITPYNATAFEKGRVDFAEAISAMFVERQNHEKR